MKPTVNRIFIGIIGLACFAPIAFIAWAVYPMMPPLCSFSRAHEKLPAISIENGDTVYCRMRYCDFRFPLPTGSRIVQTNIESGGFDTINGTISVFGASGGSVNMRDYAELLQKKHFNLGIADASCCVGTNVPDIPITVAGKMIHYPVLSDFTAGSIDQVGGTLQIGTVSNLVQIRFGYFGDY